MTGRRRQYKGLRRHELKIIFDVCLNFLYDYSVASSENRKHDLLLPTAAPPLSPLFGLL